MDKWLNVLESKPNNKSINFNGPVTN